MTGRKRFSFSLARSTHFNFTLLGYVQSATQFCLSPCAPGGRSGRCVYTFCAPTGRYLTILISVHLIKHLRPKTYYVRWYFNVKDSQLQHIADVRAMHCSTLVLTARSVHTPKRTRVGGIGGCLGELKATVRLASCLSEVPRRGWTERKGWPPASFAPPVGTSTMCIGEMF